MKKCELCDSVAKMYCESDEAMLCWECDSRVHGANFLVAKHLRTLLCHLCQSLTPWNGSGPKLGPSVSVCNKCVNANASREDQRNNEQTTHGDDQEDEDDLDDADHDESKDDDDDSSGGDEDNQVVPWSSSPTPPVSTCSTSEEGGGGGGASSSSSSSSSSKSRTTPLLSLKRMRDTIEPRAQHENPGGSSFSISRQQQTKTKTKTNNLSNELSASSQSRAFRSLKGCGSRRQIDE